MDCALGGLEGEDVDLARTAHQAEHAVRGDQDPRAAGQQGYPMLHRTRHLFIRHQTAVINSIRAHLAEFGIVARVGRQGVEELLDTAADPKDRRLPESARACVIALGMQLRMLKAQVLEFDRRIMAWHRSNATSRRLDDIRCRPCAGHCSCRRCC
jgi:transposase